MGEVGVGVVIMLLFRLVVILGLLEEEIFAMELNVAFMLLIIMHGHGKFVLLSAQFWFHKLSNIV